MALPRYDETVKNFVMMLAKVVCRDEEALRLGTNFVGLVRPLAVAVAQCNEVEVTEEIVNTMKQKITLLSAIFASLEEMKRFEDSNPIIGIYKELNPVLMASFKKFGAVEKIIEGICSITKHTMRSINKHFFPYIQDFARQVIEGYKTHSFSTYLYCGEFTVSVYGPMPEFEGILREMFNLLGTHTFDILSKGGYTNYPNIIEDFFGMCLRYMKYAPKLVFESEIISSLLQFSIVVIGIEHIDAAKALYLFLDKFFEHFLMHSEKVSLDDKELTALNFVFENGPLITKKLILTLCAAPYQGLHEFIISTLITMKDSLPKTTIRWIHDAIQLVACGVIVGAGGLPDRGGEGGV